MRRQAGVSTVVLLSVLLCSTNAFQAAAAASDSHQLFSSQDFHFHDFYSSFLSGMHAVFGFFGSRPAAAPEPTVDFMEAAASYDSMPPVANPDWYDESNEAGAPIGAPNSNHQMIVSEEEEGLMPSQADEGDTNLITYQIKRPKSKAHSPAPHKKGPAAALQKRLKKEANSRKAHDQWMHKREEEFQPERRQLAEAPTAGLNVFSLLLNETCESITCGGKCCDSLYTYSSTGNTTCTEPAPTCSANDQCQMIKPNETVGCEGLALQFYDYPENSTVSNEDTTMFGYTCPTEGDNACSFLNTYATDLSLCTEGACVTDASGALQCVPLSRGTSMYGCTAAIFMYTNPGQALPPSSSGDTAREGVRVSNDINTPAGQKADVAG